MRYGHDGHNVRLGSVVESKRKPIQHDSPGSALRRRKTLRGLPDSLDRNRQLLKKGRGCEQTTLFVPRLSVIDLASGSRVKLNGHSAEP